MAKIIKELTAMKSTREVTNKCVIMGKEGRNPKILESHVRQPKNNTEFDVVNKAKCRTELDKYLAKETATSQERYTQHCRYCGTHQPRQSLA